MKSCLLVVFLSLSAYVFAQGNSPVLSTRLSGAFADNTFTTSNGESVNLSVSQGTNGNNQEQTLLIFDYLVRTDSSSTFVFAGGYISNDAFVVHSDNTASLNVDTSQVAGFMTTACTTTFSTHSTSCTSGPFGVVQIDWEQNGVTSNRSHAEDWKTFPGGRLHTQTISDLNSASSTGSLLGTSFDAQKGDIGTTSNSLFEIFQN